MNIKNPFPLLLGGKFLYCAFEFQETENYFGNFRNIGGFIASEGTEICSVQDAEKRFWETTGKTYDANAEFSIITVRISDRLLQDNSCLFHAVAIMHQNKAWLISGPPGVGKTTQYRNLKELYPDEFEMICGDKPMLSLENDGQIMVYPTPWNGKEGLRGDTAFPLAGIIFLRRGDQNKITPIKPFEAVIPFYRSIIQSAETEDILKQASSLMNCILQRVPSWSMTSAIIPDSTELLYNEVFSSYEQ